MKHSKTENLIGHYLAAVNHQFWLYLFSLWPCLCCTHQSAPLHSTPLTGWAIISRQSAQPSENSPVQLTFTVLICQCGNHLPRCDSQHQHIMP